VSAILLPRPAAADQRLAVDVDGDGRSDRVTVEVGEPFVINVWLSESGRTYVLRSRQPLAQIVVRDLDGDHRPELIASDQAARIHVWRRHESGFRRFHPRSILPSAFSGRDRRGVDDTDDERPSAIAPPTAMAIALTVSSQPRAPAPVTFRSLPPDSRPSRSSRTADPFVPRPPPAHLWL
jgi:hypothetical protein